MNHLLVRFWICRNSSDFLTANYKGIHFRTDQDHQYWSFYLEAQKDGLNCFYSNNVLLILWMLRLFGCFVVVSFDNKTEKQTLCADFWDMQQTYSRRIDKNFVYTRTDVAQKHSIWYVHTHCYQALHPTGNPAGMCCRHTPLPLSFLIKNKVWRSDPAHSQYNHTHIENMDSHFLQLSSNSGGWPQSNRTNCTLTTAFCLCKQLSSTHIYIKIHDEVLT